LFLYKDDTMGFISIKNLFHDYFRHNEEGDIVDQVTAINGVDLTIEKGEFIAILGHNGSGKSTLAKHLNSILQPTRGTVTVGGFDTMDQKHIWDIRKQAGMIFQNPDNQIIGTIVEEDVAFGPENLGVEPDEIAKRVKNSLEAVGMTAYEKASPNKLSGGQKQRIAIAGIMAMEPDCIIMDEPTAMLDPIGRKEVLKTAKRLNKEKGITIILITHNMEEVTGVDRVYVMDHGQVVMAGTPKEIFSQIEQLEEIRLEVPTAARLAYELRKAGIDLPEGIITEQELIQALKGE
jgi:energy-coupling factor transport system ATP-binding protein